MERAVEEPEVAASGEPILAWKVHLLKEQPWRVLPLVPVVVLSFVISYVYCPNFIMPVVVLFLFLSALSEYLFPISYEINSRGASRRTLFGYAFIEWSKVRKCYLDDHGVKLSPLPEQSRLETYRGVYLRFGDHRDEIIEVVRDLRDAGRTDD